MVITMYFMKAQKNPKNRHTAPHFTAQAESTDNKPNTILHLDTYRFPDDTTYDRIVNHAILTTMSLSFNLNEWS